MDFCWDQEKIAGQIMCKPEACNTLTCHPQADMLLAGEDGGLLYFIGLLWEWRDRWRRECAGRQ